VHICSSTTRRIRMVSTERFEENNSLRMQAKFVQLEHIKVVQNE
jgi:hypothetical protein